MVLPQTKYILLPHHAMPHILYMFDLVIKPFEAYVWHPQFWGTKSVCQVQLYDPGIKWRNYYFFA